MLLADAALPGQVLARQAGREGARAGCRAPPLPVALVRVAAPQVQRAQPDAVRVDGAAVREPHRVAAAVHPVRRSVTHLRVEAGARLLPLVLPVGRRGDRRRGASRVGALRAVRKAEDFPV